MSWDLTSKFIRAKLPLSPSEKLIFLCIIDRFGDNDFSFQRQKSLAYQTGLHPVTVNKLIQGMIKSGWLDQLKTKKSIKYRLGENAHKFINEEKSISLTLISN